MPTNLPPEYFEIDKLYRAATDPGEKVELLEELLSVIPKHKGTDHLRANYRRRLSKLKAAAAQTRKTTSKRDTIFRIDKAGAGQVVVVGPPNVGKSALVAALTNANPEVSDVPHTTWEPTPGMMAFENVQIQLIDTPPLSKDFVEPRLRELIRRADMILLVVDLEADPIQQLEDTVDVLTGFHVVPQHIQDRYPIERDTVCVPILVLTNKCDDQEGDELFEICCELIEEEWPILPISATTGKNFDRLGNRIYQGLDIIRVYSQAPGEEYDPNAPFVLKRGSTVEEFAGKVHQDFARNLKTARVWGEAVYDGQSVGRDYVLRDGDIIELHT